MEHFLDSQLPFKAEVYAVFRQHPELLVAEEEGLSKEEHRELVRRCLQAVLAAGYSPMSYFARDHAKYFYLAELLSLVDLSLVGDAHTHPTPRSSALRRRVCRRCCGWCSVTTAPRPRGLPPCFAMQTVKLGVQYSLWGGSVVNLGTERHRKKYFDDIDRFRLPGELGRRGKGSWTLCL